MHLYQAEYQLPGLWKLATTLTDSAERYGTDKCSVEWKSQQSRLEYVVLVDGRHICRVRACKAKVDETFDEDGQDDHWVVPFLE